LKGKTAVEKGSQESRLTMIAIGTVAAVVTMKTPVDPQRRTDSEIRQDWRRHHFRSFRAFSCESIADHSSGKRDYILLEYNECGYRREKIDSHQKGRVRVW